MTSRSFVPHESVAIALGADGIADALSASGADVTRNGSRGLLWAEPMVEIERDALLARVQVVEGPALLGVATAVGKGPELTGGIAHDWMVAEWALPMRGRLLRLSVRWAAI